VSEECGAPQRHLTGTLSEERVKALRNTKNPPKRTPKEDLNEKENAGPKVEREEWGQVSQQEKKGKFCCKSQVEIVVFSEKSTPLLVSTEFEISQVSNKK